MDFDIIIDSTATLVASVALYIEVTPVMTGDTAPLPYEAFANSEATYATIPHYAWNAFDAAGDEGVNLVPVLTSNTSASATVTVSASTELNAGNAAWHAFDDVGGNARWAANTSTGWLKAAFVTAKTVKSYCVGASDTYLVNPNTPKSWTFEGSNDNTNWTQLDSQTNQINWELTEQRFYNIPNTDAYKYYRISILTTNYVNPPATDSYCRINFFGLYETATSRYPEWASEATVLSGATDCGYIGMSFGGVGTRVTTYQIRATSLRGGSPRTWRLEASDDLLSWSTVHDQTSPVTSWLRTTSLKTYTVTTPNDYKYYRLFVVTQNSIESPSVGVGADPTRVQELRMFSDFTRVFDTSFTTTASFSADYNPEVYAFNAALDAKSELVAIFQVPEVNFSTTALSGFSASVYRGVLCDFIASAKMELSGSYIKPSENIFDAKSGLEAAYVGGVVFTATLEAGSSLEAVCFGVSAFSADLSAKAEFNGDYGAGKSYLFATDTKSSLEAEIHQAIKFTCDLNASSVLTADFVQRPLFDLTTIFASELTATFITYQPPLTSSVWAVNLQSSAHSQYDNYNFNSFCRHKGVYLGSSATGVYQLTGNSDDGAAINAHVETGDIEPAQAQTYLHDIFIDGRSDDLLNVTVTTDEIRQVEYQTIMGSMENNASVRRCKTARGVKGRKWRIRIANEAGAKMELLKMEPKFIATSRHA